MKYNDGVALDANMRATICPQCQNEEFSEQAYHCRICGQILYNECEGGRDYNGNDYTHNNPGNARFCEQCGTKTRFLREGLLKPWNELPKDENGVVIITPFETAMPFVSSAQVSPAVAPDFLNDMQELDDGELPF